MGIVIYLISKKSTIKILDNENIVKVGPERFELSTSRLSAGRANHAMPWAHRGIRAYEEGVNKIYLRNR